MAPKSGPPTPKTITVTVIDVATKRPRLTFPISVDRANRLKFTPDGKRVLVSGLGANPNAQGSSADVASLVVIDVATHKEVKKFNLGGGSAASSFFPTARAPTSPSAPETRSSPSTSTSSKVMRELPTGKIPTASPGPTLVSAQFSVQGFPTPAPFGFGGWIAFTKVDNGSEVMMGDLVLLQRKNQPRSLRVAQYGIDVTALHNHFFWDDPHVYHMHVHGMGKAADLAQRVKPGLDLIAISNRNRPPPPNSASAPLDTAKLCPNFGHEGEQNRTGLHTLGRDDLDMKEYGAVITLAWA
jgi:hypothetical protein